MLYFSGTTRIRGLSIGLMDVGYKRILIALRRLVFLFQLPAHLGVPDVQLVLDRLYPGYELNAP